MPNKDYYDILGIERGADDKEIHSAYRRRARELHPDRNKHDPKAEDKFKELGEAYRILSDPQKRRQYDMFGSVGGDYAPPPGWSGARYDFGEPFAPEDFGYSQGFDFDALFDDILSRMPRRGGFRNVRMTYERGSDIEVELPLTVEDLFKSATRQIRIAVTRRCEGCEGEGRISGAVCRECSGTGKVTRRKAYKINVPPGLGHGDVIRLAGQGNPSPGGMGAAGDLLVRLKVKPHPRYRVSGRDLEVDIRVPDYQAALGGKVEVEAPTGKLSLNLPAGIASGTKLKVRGQGLPRRGGGYGNLLVNVVVWVPENLTPEQKELYRKLRDTQK